MGLDNNDGAERVVGIVQAISFTARLKEASKELHKKGATFVDHEQIRSTHCYYEPQSPSDDNNYYSLAIVAFALKVAVQTTNVSLASRYDLIILTHADWTN